MLKLNRILPLFFAFVFTIPVFAGSNDTENIKLEKNNFRIVLSDNEPEPVKIAIEAFKKDFSKVMGFQPVVANNVDNDNTLPQIVIVNRSSEALNIPFDKNKKLDGFESHRVYADPKTNRIYLEGYDLRGTIYAIYTFSEFFLGVPPLHYWSSWVPVKKNEIHIAGECDIFFKSPQVRYRSILTGDQDFFMPWKKISDENQNVWLETTLRLKLNTVECYSTIEPGYKLSYYAYLIDKYGLVITSHHIAALNTSFSTWDTYWTEQRNTTPPELLLSNEKEILEFFRYNAETVVKNGIENLWTVAFRGKVDQPFWSVFDDAPESDKDRADVINRMLQIQLDIIKEATGNPDPYVRITFYDELASLIKRIPRGSASG
ncbi:MAG: glycosyl hydrolase 115 family protein, partial [Bacteroidetes bacterium]|nr:glycosyl hydrolase 115 family protein [Bacteroidota bacterium]